MSTYKIKEGQTALDVVNQLFTNTDNIGTLYLSNIDFDINKMQPGLELTYTEPKPTQSLNEIKNNGYTFINRDNVVFGFSFQEDVPAGVINVPEFANTYVYMVPTQTWQWLTETDYSFTMLEGGVFQIYAEIY